MDLEIHCEHKQHTFDRFCKTTIKHEAFNAFRQIRNQQKRFVSLSDLSEEASEQLATYDTYPWEYTAFPVEDEVILIKDDALADALNALPQDHEVGRLTEEFFPEHDIRLVAVSDNTDTAEGENEMAPIRNLFNEWLS